MSSQAIDWSQLWYPGPTRVFSDAELARAGNDPPSRTLIVMLLINLALLTLAFLVTAPSKITAELTSLLAGMTVIGMGQARVLWRRPTRRALMSHALGAVILVWAFALAWRWRLPDPALRNWLVAFSSGVALASIVGLWFVTVFRAEQIEARLRELDERDQAAEMARQLLAAQVQPHFIFNSLAALSHWVQTKDDRAPALLQALTAYLRATLPLFQARLLPLGDELAAVRNYLQVMQLRLGERLQTALEVPETLWTVQLPPGILLTLVENAIEHGIEPRLRGGRIRMTAARAARQLCIEVHDDGPGPAPAVPEGLGLSNLRARLAQTFGAAATLELRAAPEGGACARLCLPITT